MASLQQVRDVSRHILVIGVLFCIGIFLLITFVRYIKGLHPTPPPPPTVSFGKLPAISFPQGAATQQVQYVLDTISGNLPDLGDRAPVYKIQQPNPTLNALQNARSLVQMMGYTANPTQISDTLYKWTNTDNLPKTIAFNIYTNDFAITSDYLSNQNVLQSNNLPDQNTAISTAMDFLQSASLMPSDIDTNKTKATLLHITNNQLTPATSLSSTQVIQVDLFQQDMNKMPIFYPDPTHSTMSLFVAGGANNPQIVLANFNHQAITSDNATYPILTAQQALDLLKKGQGYVASFDGTSSTVSIHNIILGYYMSDKPQKYLEPIIVFEGDHDFYAYIPAVTDAWINK